MFGLNLYLHNSLSSDLKSQKSPLIDPFLVVIISNNSRVGNKLARLNYQFNKRQKELARLKRKKDMRQRYVISRNGAKNKLIIREYAIIDKNLKKVPSSMLEKRNFSFLCEETYESEIIVNSISKGMNALIASIRTRNIFPIEPYAIKIAESVTALYNSSEGGPVELIFDDADLISI